MAASGNLSGDSSQTTEEEGLVRVGSGKDKGVRIRGAGLRKQGLE